MTDFGSASGLVHAPWRNRTAAAAQWNLSLDTFLWASELLLLAARASDGQLADMVTDRLTPGLNRCFEQACTFPVGSPLPRPACCGGIGPGQVRTSLR